MALKIIQNNKPVDKPEYPKQIICPWCNSVLEFDQADIKNVPVTVAKPEPEDIAIKANISTGKGFNCPVCTNVVVTG